MLYSAGPPLTGQPLLTESYRREKSRIESEVIEVKEEDKCLTFSNRFKMAGT